LGLYESMKDILRSPPSSQKDLPFWKKMIGGGTAGAIGAAIATPTDVLKIRMQAEGKLAQGEKPRYATTLGSIHTITKFDGFKGLYQGLIPTTQRAFIISAAMMPTYDQSKHFVLQRGWLTQDNIYAHATAGFVAGFAMAVVTSPIDVIKTRLMNQSSAVRDGEFGTNVKTTYNGMLDCFVKLLQKEGIEGLYKGFFPNWARLGPHTVLALVLFEKLRIIVGLPPI